MADITNLTNPFVDGEVITMDKFGIIVSKVNEIIAKVNGQEPTPTEAEFFSTDNYGEPFIGTLAECYIPYSGGNIAFRVYNGVLYVYSKVVSGQQNNNNWTYSRNLKTGIQSGVIQITANAPTSTNPINDPNVHEGDVLGYFVIKDLDKLKAISTNLQYTNTNDNIRKLNCSPTIKDGIQSGELHIDVL